jgi:hypothetical protein
VNQYIQVFSNSAPNLGQAAAELVQLQESSELRAALKRFFRAAFELADPEMRARLANFQGRPVSSARHFEQRLSRWFSATGAFEIERSAIDCAWECTSRDEAGVSYMGACVGEQRLLARIPAKTLCSNAGGFEPDSTQVLLEHGVFTFVATRNTPSS